MQFAVPRAPAQLGHGMVRRRQSRESNLKRSFSGRLDMAHRRRRRAALPWPQRLTEQQRVILGLIWLGCGGKAIALYLGCSEGCARNQILRVWVPLPHPHPSWWVIPFSWVTATTTHTPAPEAIPSTMCASTGGRRWGCQELVGWRGEYG